MMADDLAAGLAAIRNRQKIAYASPRAMAESGADVPRLLSAVEAVLALHQPEGEVIYTSCAAHVITGPSGRDPLRFDKMAECPDCQRRRIVVCGHCDCSHDEWPCPTVRAIAKALLGEAVAGGG
jgi:hypothetical protein